MSDDDQTRDEIEKVSSSSNILSVVSPPDLPRKRPGAEAGGSGSIYFFMVSFFAGVGFLRCD